MINSISMANAAVKSRNFQNIPVITKNQSEPENISSAPQKLASFPTKSYLAQMPKVAFTGLWGKTEKEEYSDGGLMYLDYITNYSYHPFKDESQCDIDYVLKDNNHEEHSDLNVPANVYISYYKYNCKEASKLPFTEAEYKTFMKNPDALDEEQRKIIHEATKDLYLDRENTVTVHDKIKNEIEEKEKAHRSRPVEERLWEVEQTVKKLEKAVFDKN